MQQVSYQPKFPKRCPDCGETSLLAFAKNRQTKSGLCVYCRTCHKTRQDKAKAGRKEEIALAHQAWAQANRDKLNARKRRDYARDSTNTKALNAKWRTANPEKVAQAKRAWSEKNKEACSAKSLAWAKANPEKRKQSRLKWVLKNPAKVFEAWKAYLARRKQQTPPWADLKAIMAFYHARPLGMTVDHCLPLKGENVSGLHVIANLQYLTREENSRKRNKVNLEDL